MLRQRWRYNLLALRLSLSREGWFAYRANTGTRFVVDRSDPASFFLYTCGHPDTAELEVLNRWLKPGDFCLDLGANIGFFAATMAAKVGHTGLVCAVEAGPMTYGTLQRTLARLRLPQIALRHGCLGKTTGMTTFYVARDPNLSPLQSVNIDPNVTAQFASVSVPLFRADDCAQHVAPQRRVALIKIDVEGAEPDVLTGCERLLESGDPPLVAVEINPSVLERNHTTPADVLRHFDRTRYEFYFINAAPGHTHPLPVNQLVPLNTHDDAGFPVLGNLIAVPRVGAFALRHKELRAVY